jgi:hypothetical protein
MHHSPLSPDDLPPQQLASDDESLRQQLEGAVARYFYEACDGVIQALLCCCEWSITTQATALTLVITCPDTLTQYRVLNNIELIGTPLGQFTSSARIRICPSDDETPLEIRVDELSVYRDSL